MTVAQGVVTALEKEGVSVLFGYPGATICPFYDALSRSGIRNVLVTQEQNAGHAASGYARISGIPGVAVTTSGPGATNLLTGLATAYMDSIPMVAITGQVNTDQIGKDVFQEADITGAAEPFTKYSFLVKQPDQIGRIMKEAFYIARSGRPGPVLVDLPMDIQKKEIDFLYPDSVHIRGYKPTFAGNAPQVRRVADAIQEAKRPLLCLGGGVLSAGAGTLLAQFAEKCHIPIVSTLMGISAVPTRHPLYFGMLGSHGTETANRAVYSADLLIIVGARVGDRAMTFPAVLEKRAQIIHIDVDPAEIGKNLGAHIPLVGDAKNILTQLIGCEIHPDTDTWLRELCARREEEKLDTSPREGAVNPRAFIKKLSDRLPDDAVVSADVGQNQIWTARSLEIRKGRLLTSGGMGTMGYSVPAAVGAKLAAPSRQTVAICGDGSFLMQAGELATIRRQNLDIKIIVMSNGMLGMVRELQDGLYDGNRTSVSLADGPDVRKLAGAFGIEAVRVPDLSQADAAIDWMLKKPGPCLLECVVPADEPTR